MNNFRVYLAEARSNWSYAMRTVVAGPRLECAYIRNLSLIFVVAREPEEQQRASSKHNC